MQWNWTSQCVLQVPREPRPLRFTSEDNLSGYLSSTRPRTMETNSSKRTTVLWASTFWRWKQSCSVSCYSLRFYWIVLLILYVLWRVWSWKMLYTLHLNTWGMIDKELLDWSKATSVYGKRYREVWMSKCFHNTIERQINFFRNWISYLH